jgi:hypothetical protein
MNLIFDGVELSSKPIAKLQFLDVACINQDGEVILIHDESFMFRFIRKAGAKGYE